MHEVLPHIYASLPFHDINCLLVALETEERLLNGERFDPEWFRDASVDALLARLRGDQKPAAVVFEWLQCVVDSATVLDRALSVYPCCELREHARTERDECQEENDVIWSMACMMTNGMCSRPFLMFMANADAELREGGLALVQQLHRNGTLTAMQHGEFLSNLMDEACVRNDTSLLRMTVARYKTLPIPPNIVRETASRQLVFAIDADFGGREDEHALQQRVETLITELGADPCYSSEGLYFTALSKACREGLERVARYLVKNRGVRPTTSADGRRCCLTMARFSEKVTLEKFIIREMYRTPTRGRC